jgi:hypothetical protein
LSGIGTLKFKLKGIFAGLAPFPPIINQPTPAFFSINTETNQLVQINSIGNCNVVGNIGVACGKYGGLDFDPSGNLWFLPVNASADTVLVRINYSTGNILQT